MALWESLSIHPPLTITSKPIRSPFITDQMQYNGFKCEINEMLLKRRNTRQILFFVAERDTSHHYTEANKTKFKAYYRCPLRGSTIGFWLKFRYLLLDITYCQWPPMWKSSGQCVSVFWFCVTAESAQYVLVACVRGQQRIRARGVVWTLSFV